MLCRPKTEMWQAAALAAGFLACAISPLSAACVTSLRSPDQPVGYDSIHLNLPAGMSQNSRDIVQDAMDSWSSENWNSEPFSFPRFQTQPEGAGRSMEPHELMSLSAAGIRAIAVEFDVSVLEDEHGNWRRYLSRAHIVDTTGRERSARSMSSS